MNRRELITEKKGLKWRTARDGDRSRRGVTDSGVGPQWDKAERVRACVFVCRPPLSIMKANQLGWQRGVLQEESQSTEPNEPGLEIRPRQRRKK